MPREKGLAYMLTHTDHIERVLEEHGPDEAPVNSSLTDDIYLRSYYWARWQLRVPLPAER